MQDVDAVSVSRSGPSLVELDDGELLAMARLNNQEAYAALFTRYTYAAHRLARHLGQRDEAEDVVSESFVQVLDLVRRGKGPDQAFRAYLFTTIRHEAGRRAKGRQRVVPTDDERQIDGVVPFGGGQLDEFEKSAIRAAYESLPGRWRTVLWHLDVEGRKPHQLGPLLDLSPNSVSALVYRARSGLREAYLQQHVKADGAVGSRACRDIRAKLSTFVRRTASERDRARVHVHLESCSDCMAIYLDLKEVNREVGAIVAPAALAVSLAGLASGLGGAGGWAALIAHVALVGKGLLLVAAPSAAAAVIATTTVVGVSAPGVVDPPRSPATAQSLSGPMHRVQVHPSPRSANEAARSDPATSSAPTSAAARANPVSPDAARPAAAAAVRPSHHPHRVDADRHRAAAQMWCLQMARRCP